MSTTNTPGRPATAGSTLRGIPRSHTTSCFGSRPWARPRCTSASDTTGRTAPVQLTTTSASVSTGVRWSKGNASAATPSSRTLLCELLGARQRAVDDVNPFDAGAHQMLGGQRAHRAGADDDCAAPGQPAQLGVGHAQRDGHHRSARGVDTGLVVHPLADRQRPLGQLVQRAPDGVVGLGGRIGATHLAEHLLFAHHGRIQAAGNGEQMLDGCLGVADVGVLGEIAEPHPGMLGQHLPDHRETAVEGLDDRVDLHPIAGGQHHGLGNE